MEDFNDSPDSEPEVFPLPNKDGLSLQQLLEIEAEVDSFENSTDQQKWKELGNVNEARATIGVSMGGSWEQAQAELNFLREL